jgi:hypothetical protein
VRPPAELVAGRGPGDSLCQLAPLVILGFAVEASMLTPIEGQRTATVFFWKS